MTSNQAFLKSKIIPQLITELEGQSTLSIFMTRGEELRQGLLHWLIDAPKEIDTLSELPRKEMQALLRDLEYWYAWLERTVNPRSNAIEDYHYVSMLQINYESSLKITQTLQHLFVTLHNLYPDSFNLEMIEYTTKLKQYIQSGNIRKIVLAKGSPTERETLEITEEDPPTL